MRSACVCTLLEDALKHDEKKNTHNIDEIGRDEWKLYKENIVLHTWNRYVSTKKYVGDQEKHRAEQESIEIKGTKLFSC